MKNIKLRAVEPEDLDELYAIENDRQLWDVGITNVPYSRFLLHEYLEQSTCDIYTDRQVRLVIVDADLGEIVGMVDLIDFDPRHQRAELGIVIKCKYRRQGYASDAIARIVDYARTFVHLHQLYVIVDFENNPARQLFQKCGFSTASELKDWLFNGKNYRKAVIMQFFL